MHVSKTLKLCFSVLLVSHTTHSKQLVTGELTTRCEQVKIIEGVLLQNVSMTPVLLCRIGSKPDQ